MKPSDAREKEREESFAATMSYARFLASQTLDTIVTSSSESRVLGNDYDRNSRKNSLSKIHMHGRGERERPDYRIADRLAGFFGKYETLAAAACYTAFATRGIRVARTTTSACFIAFVYENKNQKIRGAFPIYLESIPSPDCREISSNAIEPSCLFHSRGRGDGLGRRRGSLPGQGRRPRNKGVLFLTSTCIEIRRELETGRRRNETGELTVYRSKDTETGGRR